jgi:predicted N-acetyltransferase YhbS
VGRLGRLAVDRAHQGQKLGAALLWDALARAARSELAVFALVVDAKDNQAGAFYLRHGFTAFGSAPRQFLYSLTNFSSARQNLP